MLTAFAYISMERKKTPNSEMRLIVRLVHLNQCSVEFHTEWAEGDTGIPLPREILKIMMLQLSRYNREHN